MMRLTIFLLCLAPFPLLATVLSITKDDTAEEYLIQVNQTFSHYGNLEMEARWNYVTDISEEHETAMVRITKKYKCTVLSNFKGPLLLKSNVIKLSRKGPDTDKSLLASQQIQSPYFIISNT